MCKGH